MPLPVPERRFCGFVACAVSFALAGCSTLPSNGPTAGTIVKRSQAADSPVKFRIINLDSNAVAALNTASQDGRVAGPTLASLAEERRVDLIGPGDVLSISIYEVGVSLFGGGMRSAAGGSFDPSARGEVFPETVVDAAGRVTLPYLGQVQVGGLTVDQAEQRIVAGLRGKSQDPRAMVAIKENVANTVFVSGSVNKPGRFKLTLSRERLLDAIASAGGSVLSGTSTVEDMLVRFVRGSNVAEARLGTIRSNSADDLVLIPGDRIELIRSARTYTVFGAVAKISQMPFDTAQVSLAEALARVGGPSDASADPSAIFLFRYSVQPASGLEEPIIYRVNMLKPESYFLAQRFLIKDKDVIYIANARANQPAKLFGIINQLFAPFITARQITN